MLTLCPHCHRHVRDSESICPFCKSSRARNKQLLAAVAIGLAATSCSGNVTYDYGDATQTTAADGSQTTSSDASQTTVPDASTTDAYTIVLAYMPAPFDAGVSEASVDSSDAIDSCSPCGCDYNMCVVTSYAAVPDPQH